MLFVINGNHLFLFNLEWTAIIFNIMIDFTIWTTNKVQQKLMTQVIGLKIVINDFCMF